MLLVCLWRANSHVEVPGSETETAQRNGLETALQTIWNDRPDETIRKSVLTFCKSLFFMTRVMSGGHSNIRLINLFSAYHCSLAGQTHATFQHLFLSVAYL